MAITTMNTKLKITKGDDVINVPIKSFPDMGTAPNMIECTTLSDTAQKFVEGVKSLAAIEFTANYDKELFEQLKAVEDDSVNYEVELGDGTKFAWVGRHTAIVVGGGVNAVLDMKLSVLPETVIAVVAAE